MTPSRSTAAGSSICCGSSRGPTLLGRHLAVDAVHEEVLPDAPRGCIQISYGVESGRHPRHEQDDRHLRSAGAFEATSIFIYGCLVKPATIQKPST
jgi:hypothetical protein